MNEVSHTQKKDFTAIWALTAHGLSLAERIAEYLPDAHIYVSDRVVGKRLSYRRFERLSDAVAGRFQAYGSHIFIMSTGIVVRVIAGLIRHKTVDPAVVVMDDAGRHAISLLSGHLGGANRLAENIAQIVEANPVITTATDVHHLPAIDMLAAENGLIIENPGAIKAVNMAILAHRPIPLHDPRGIFPKQIAGLQWTSWTTEESAPGVFIDDIHTESSNDVLVLRPSSLCAGIGCNRGTDPLEIRGLLTSVIKEHGLAIGSLYRIGTIDIKRDEVGILTVAHDLGCTMAFYTKEELNRVEDVPTPSEIVKKYTGAKSVCEAAAILASKMGVLVVPKQRTKNVTVAIARTGSIS
jgi:cobalt-precorrin 5A hydrolase